MILQVRVRLGKVVVVKERGSLVRGKRRGLQCHRKTPVPHGHSPEPGASTGSQSVLWPILSIATLQQLEPGFPIE